MTETEGELTATYVATAHGTCEESNAARCGNCSAILRIRSLTTDNVTSQTA